MPASTRSGTLSLAELSGNSTFALPQPAGVTPFWFVPSHVSSLSMTAAADQPVNVDLFWQGGNPDVYSSATGNTTTVTATGSPLTPGIWETDLGQTGPFWWTGAGRHRVGFGDGGRPAVRYGRQLAVGDFMAAGVAGQSASAVKLDLGAISKRLAAQRQGQNPWSVPNKGGSILHAVHDDDDHGDDHAERGGRHPGPRSPVHRCF